MRVAHFSTQFELVGGIENYLKALLPAQAAAGADVRLYVASEGDDRTAAGVAITHLGEPTKIAGRFKHPKGILGEARRALAWADVVHVHVPFAISSIVPLMLPSQKPVVLSCYAHPDHFPSVRRRLQIRAVAGRASAIFVLSTGERDVLEAAGVPPRRLQFVRSGMSDELLAVGTAPSLGRDLILCVGRLVDYKRHELVIEATAGAGMLDRLRIVGVGGRRAAIAALIERHGGDPERVMLGQISDTDLASLLGRARLLVSLSTQESLGLVLLEALAAGARPIASDIPAHRDTLVAAGLGDFLVPIDLGPQAVAERITSAYALEEQPTWRPPSWAEAAAEMLDRYRQILRA